MICSIEIPIIRGGWLIQCIDSVLQQTSPNWMLSLLWDQGDALSDELLDRIASGGHPRIRVHRAPERLGIARARQYLTDHSSGDIIVPLDDDDVLEPQAVSRFLSTAAAKPWAGIVRARRRFIDDRGHPVLMDDWFSFEPRQYQAGATIDITNHSQPYAIRRSVLEAVGGWTGFADYEFAGEDCDAFMRIEELAEVVLLDEHLYQYRIHNQRTSLRLAQRDAEELWRRIADASITRRGLELKRTNDRPPFSYERVAKLLAKLPDIEFVVPFFENNECEIEYIAARPNNQPELFALSIDSHFVQFFHPRLDHFNRVEIALAANGPVKGVLRVAFFAAPDATSPALELEQIVDAASGFDFEFVRFACPDKGDAAVSFARMEIFFVSDDFLQEHKVFLQLISHQGQPHAMLRLFRAKPGFAAVQLERCLASLEKAGVAPDAVHVIRKRQSSSANRNEGFRHTRSQWICFLDDDAEVAESTLQRMLDSARRHGAHLCGPKLLVPSGLLYSGPAYTNPISREARVAGAGERDDGSFDATTLVPWLPSTVLLVHRSVMLATGGFDERYAGSQHEDVDFSFRARARGFSCLYVGSAVAIHHNLLRNTNLKRNMDYFRTRWAAQPGLFRWP